MGCGTRTAEIGGDSRDIGGGEGRVRNYKKKLIGIKTKLF
jgi:hypothetical protein